MIISVESGEGIESERADGHSLSLVRLVESGEGIERFYIQYVAAYFVAGGIR